MHLIDKLAGSLQNLINQGNNAGPGQSRYSDWVTGGEAWADSAVDNTMGAILKPRQTIRRMTGQKPGERDWGKTLSGAKDFAWGMGDRIYRAGGALGRAGLRGLNAMGGAQGVATGVAMTGASVIGAGFRAAGGFELGARTLMTGGLFSGVPKDAVEAYLPGWKRYGWDDVRKYGINPRILRRYVAARAAHALFEGFDEALNPSVAPPSMFVGAGGGIRHRNDLGAHAGYGQQLLGQNSLLSGFSQMSTARKMALMDAVI